MKKTLVALALLSVLAVGPANAWLIQGVADSTGKQLLVSSGGITAVAGTSDRYIPLGYTATPSATYFKSMTFSSAGTIKSLKLKENTTPAAGKTWDATVYVNGSSTAATCQSTNAAPTCNWIGSVSISAGDHAAILIHPTGTPGSSIPNVSVGFTPTTANETVIPAAPIAGGTFSAAGASVVAAFSGLTPGANNTTKQAGILPDGGNITAMYVASVAPGTAASGKSYAYFLAKNGSASTITATISETATSANDTGHTVSVSAGDSLQAQATPTSTPTASDAGLGFRYIPTTTAAYSFLSSSDVSLSNSAVRYIGITSAAAASATEADVQNITHSQTFSKLQVKLDGAPGTAASGKKYTVTLRVNGVDSALTCDVLDTATTCLATGSVVVIDNDLVNFSITPANTPTSRGFGGSLLATR